MSGMNSSRENDASSYMENPPGVMQPNESKHHRTQPIITISSSDSSGEVGNKQGARINCTNGMPTVTNFLGNMEGEVSSHAHAITVDNHNTVSAASLFDSVNSSQIGGRASNQSHIHGFAVNDDDDSMSIAALLNDFNDPLVEHDFINMGSNAAAGVQLNNQFDTKPNTSQAYSHKVHDVVANQFSNFQRPQVIDSCISSGGNSAAGVGQNSQQGAGIGESHVHGVMVNANNDGIKFSPSFNKFCSRSVNIGNKTASGIRAISQGGAPAGTSLVHGASNNPNVKNSLIRSNNSKSLQMNSGPINVRGNMAAGLRANSQGGAAPNPIRQIHGVTASSTNDMSSGNLLINLQASGVNRRSMTTGGNVAAGVGVNSQNKAVVASDLRSNSLSLDETLGPQNERNLVSAESDKPELFQSQYHKRSMVGNNTMRRENQTGVAPCTEQIENNFLNLGFGGNSAAHFPFHALGGGVTGWPVVSQLYNFHTPQPDGNFLSLGGNVADRFLSNNSNQTIAHTNDGANPNQFGISQTPPATVQYLPMPSGRALGTGGNRNVGSANMYPNSGVQRPLGVAPTPFNSIPVGLRANEQARLSRVAPAASNHMGIQHGSFPNHLQQAYMYGTRSILANPHMVSPHSNSVQRTFAPDNSGNPVALDDATMSQAAKMVTDLSVQSKQALTNQGTALVSSRGKRGASEGGLSAQSAKVSRTPSARGRPARVAGHTVASQTPVPVASHTGAAQTPVPMAGHMVASQRPVPLAGHTGVAQRPNPMAGFAGAAFRPLPLANLSGTAQTYRAITQPIQGSKNSPAQAAVRTAQSKLIPQPSKAPSNPSQARIYHLKWDGPPKSSHSTGENCQLCKRDLTYAPTGPFTQPPISPAVAVLPCNHVFHDECLARITPVEQSKNPPCIPCAIGTS